MNRPLFLGPFVLFAAVWFSVALLYSLRLSELLLFPTGEVWRVVSTLLLPFLTVVLGYGVTYRFLQVGYPLRKKRAYLNLDALEKALRLGFRIWAAASVVEIIVSGGLPIIWLLQGSSKTYLDFGIPMIHGFLNSLLLAIALCRVALFLKSGQKRHLLIPAFVLIWSMLSVTRNMMLVSLVEWVSSSSE